MRRWQTQTSLANQMIDEGCFLEFGSTGSLEIADHLTIIPSDQVLVGTVGSSNVAGGGSSLEVNVLREKPNAAIAEQNVRSSRVLASQSLRVRIEATGGVVDGPTSRNADFVDTVAIVTFGTACPGLHVDGDIVELVCHFSGKRSVAETVGDVPEANSAIAKKAPIVRRVVPRLSMVDVRCVVGAPSIHQISLSSPGRANV